MCCSHQFHVTPQMHTYVGLKELYFQFINLEYLNKLLIFRYDFKKINKRYGGVFFENFVLIFEYFLIKIIFALAREIPGYTPRSEIKRRGRKPSTKQWHPTLTRSS